MRNIFRLKKELNYAAIKDKWKKKLKQLQRRVLRVFFSKKKTNYYKPVRVSTFWSNSYIEYESYSDKNQNTISWRIS